VSTVTAPEVRGIAIGSAPRSLLPRLLLCAFVTTLLLVSSCSLTERAAAGSNNSGVAILGGSGSGNASASSNATTGSNASSSSSLPPSGHQSITVSVTGPNGQSLNDFNVEGIMVQPPAPTGVGNFTIVFFGFGNGSIVFSGTHISTLLAVAQEWINYQGQAEAADSSPVILLLVTYEDLALQEDFFQQSYVNITAPQILAGASAATTVQMSLAASTQTAAYIGGISTSWTCIICWVPGTANIYPSTGYGPVPTAWDVQPYASDAAYGSVLDVLIGSATSIFSVGYVAGPNLPTAGGSVGLGFNAGGASWTISSASAHGSWTQPFSAGAGYYEDYIQGDMIGQLWQEYSICGFVYGIWVCNPTSPPHSLNNYQYITGVDNVQVVSNIVTMASTTTFPSYWPSLSSFYGYQLYNTYTGTGNPSPTYSVYSSDFVNTFSQHDTSWLNVGIPVGAILAAVGAPAIAGAIAGKISATLSSSSLSFTWGQGIFDAPAGYTICVYSDVGSQNYALTNGLTGPLALTGLRIVTSSYPGSCQPVSAGGGGCVATGTPILTSTGFVNVQNLQVGVSKIKAYDVATQQFTLETLKWLNSSTSTALVNINNGALLVTAADQPLYVTNQSFTGWINGPQNLTIGDYLLNPVSGLWIEVNELNFVTTATTVYDVAAAPGQTRTFDAAGILTEVKEA
jgi:hypothetical protein